jgi:hypothetical protein
VSQGWRRVKPSEGTLKGFWKKKPQSELELKIRANSEHNGRPADSVIDLSAPCEEIRQNVYKGEGLPGLAT